jgi:uncharacterized protein
VIRVVIDTNVLVSGLLSPSSNPSLVLKAIAERLIRPCISDPILREYRDVLARPKFRFSERTVTELLYLIRDRGEMQPPVQSDHDGPDPGDFMFMHCAVTGQASYLVTGNKRHFPTQFYGSARVVSARQLIDQLKPLA